MATIKKTTVKKTTVSKVAAEKKATPVNTTVTKAVEKTPAVKAAVVTKTATKTPAVKVEAVKTTAKPAAAKKAATKKIAFSLPQPAVAQAKKVGLVGDFNGWDVNKPVELKKQKDGSFATTIELATGREYEYRFLINGEVWENDWKADKYVPTPFGTFNSVVTVA